MEKLKSNITTKQITTFLALSAPLIRMVLLPNMLFGTAGRDAYIAVLLFGVLDLAFLFIVIDIINNDKRPLFDIISSVVGESVTKVIFMLYGILLLLKTLFPLIDQGVMVNMALYDTPPSILFTLPIYVLVCYAGIKGVNATFRVNQLIIPFIIASLFVLVLLAIEGCDFSAILPIMENGATPLAKTFYQYPLWFGDFLLLLLLVNNIDRSKHFTAKMVVAHVIAVIISVFMFVLVVGIYGSTTGLQHFFLTKISKYSPYFQNLGRLDFVFIIILFGGMMLVAAITFAIAIQFIARSINVNTCWLSVVLVTILAVSSAMITSKYRMVIEFFGKYVSIFIIVMQYVLPIAIFIMSKSKRSKVHESKN